MTEIMMVAVLVELLLHIRERNFLIEFHKSDTEMVQEWLRNSRQRNIELELDTEHHKSIIVAQISMLNDRAEDITDLKRKIAARKGADTKRAKKIGQCVVVSEYMGDSVRAYSSNLDMTGEFKPTAKEAKRSFEALLGLQGKIEWEEEG